MVFRVRGVAINVQGNPPSPSNVLTHNDMVRKNQLNCSNQQ